MPPVIKIHILAIIFLSHIGDDYALQHGFSSDTWHSYAVNSGAANREELILQNFAISAFGSVHSIKKWQVYKHKNDVTVLGLGDNFIQVTPLDSIGDSYIFKDPGVEFSNIVVFKSWSVRYQKNENFAVALVFGNHDESFLSVYHLPDENQFAHLWKWSVNRNISHIDVFYFDQKLKVLMISNSYNSTSAEIYKLSVEQDWELQLFDRFSLENNPSESQITVCNDDIYLTFLFPKLDAVHIYRYQKSISGQSSFVIYQKIVSKHIKSFTAYCFEFHFYVAIASLNSSIYKFYNDPETSFIIKGNLGYRNSWFVVPLNTYRKNIVLLGEGDRSTAVVVPTGNLELNINTTLSHLLCKGASSCHEDSYFSSKGAATFSSNDEQYVVFTSISGESKLLNFTAKLKPTRSEVEVQLEELFLYKDSLQALWNEQVASMNLLDAAINKIQTVYNESKIQWKVKQMRAESVTISSKPNATIDNFEYAHNTHWIDDDYSVYLDLRAEPHSDIVLNNMITQINVLFNDIESTDHIEITSLSGLLAYNVSFLRSVTINQLELDHLNRINVNEMLENSFMLNSDRKIGGVKTITNIHASNIYFEKLGDNLASDFIYSDDLSDTNGGSVINGILVYENDLKILDNVQLLPGSDAGLSSKLFPFHNGFSFSDKITFDHLSISKESVVEKSINDKPLILPVHNSPFDILSLGNVNQARIETVNIHDNLYVGYINGRHFGHAFRRNKTLGSSIDPGKLYFTDNLEVSNLNGVTFPDGFLTVNSEESVMVGGDKNFNGELIAKDLFLQVQNVGVKFHSFNNLEISEHLIVDQINTFGWERVSDILRQDKGKQSLTGLKQFKRCSLSNNLIITGQLNSQNVNDILDTAADQNLTSQYMKDVEFVRLKVFGTVNGVDVENARKSTVRLLSNGNYQSKLIFDKDNAPHLQNIMISEILNNSSVTKMTEDVITSEVLNFNGVNLKNVIIIGSVTSNDMINNVNLTDFNINKFSLTRPQNVSSDLNHEFVNVRNLNVLSSVKPGVAVERGMNLDDVYAMLNRTSHAVKLIVVKGDVKTVNGVNKFSLMDYGKKAVDITKSSSVLKKITFTEPVAFNSIKVLGRIQGHQLRHLYHDLIYDTSYVYVKSFKEFPNELDVMDKLKAVSINGKSVHKIATNKGDQSIKGPITVYGNVTVNGNITSYGSINGLKMTDLSKKYSSKYSSYLIFGNVELQAHDIEQLVVEGSIKNKSFSSFVEECIFTNSDSYISAMKTFSGPVNLQKNLLIEGTLNGLNVHQLSKDIIFKGSTLLIEGSLILGKTILKNLEIASDFNATLIHGFDTNDWLEESISLNDAVNIRGKKTFHSPHCLGNIATDHINKILLIGIIPLRSQQFIPCSGYFPKLFSESHISVGHMINDKILGLEYEDSVMVDQDQEIKGRLTFVHDFTAVKDVTVNNAMNKDLSNLITLYTNQTISSVLNFDSAFISNYNVEELKFINNIDLIHWKKLGITLNTNQTITSSWTVRGNITALGGVDGDSLLDAKNIPDIKVSITKVQMLTSYIQNKTVIDYNRQCRDVVKYSQRIAMQPSVLHDLEVVQILKTSVHIESVIQFQANGIHYMTVTFFHDCLSFLYRWNTSKFIFENRIKIGPVDKWMALYHNNRTYLITSSTSHVTCEENSRKGNIWVFYGNNGKYGHLHTTDGFADITKSDISDKFYTISGSGDVLEWSLGGKINSKLIVSLGDENYHFLDFQVLKELAFTNGRYIKDQRNEVVYEFRKSVKDRITVTIIKGKMLTVVPYQDEVVLYENLLTNKIYVSVPVSSVRSVISLSSADGHPHLAYVMQNKYLEVINVEGASRVIRKLSITLPCQQLMNITIYRGEDLIPRQFVMAVQNKKIHIFEAHFVGNLYEQADLDCT